MELHFSVTPAHTAARLAQKLPQATAKHDRLIARVEDWQQRVVALLPNWLSRSYVPRQPFQRLNHRLIEHNLRVSLKAAEGAYCLSFDEHGFTLRRGKGAASGLAWTQITHLEETADFYALSDARLHRKQRAYRIARHSDLMPAADYQRGLQAFLEKCPIAPATH